MQAVDLRNVRVMWGGLAVSSRPCQVGGEPAIEPEAVVKSDRLEVQRAICSLEVASREEMGGEKGAQRSAWC